MDTTERFGTAQHKGLFLLGCSGGCGAQATAAPDPDTCHLFPTASGWGCFPETISLNCNAAPALFFIAVCTIETRSSSTCPPSPNLTSSWWKILEMGEEGRAPGEPFWCLITWGGEVAARLRELSVRWGTGLEAPGYSRLPDSPASLSKLLGFTFTSASSPPHPHIPTSAPLKSLPTGEVWLPPYGTSFSHLSGIVWAGSRVSPKQGL